MNLLPKKKQRIGKVSSTKAEVKQFETVKYVQKTSRRGYISLGEGKPAHMAPEVPEGLLKNM